MCTLWRLLRDGTDWIWSLLTSFSHRAKPERALCRWENTKTWTTNSPKSLSWGGRDESGPCTFQSCTQMSLNKRSCCQHPESPCFTLHIQTCSAAVARSSLQAGSWTPVILRAQERSMRGNTGVFSFPLNQCRADIFFTPVPTVVLRKSFICFHTRHETNHITQSAAHSSPHLSHINIPQKRFCICEWWMLIKMRRIWNLLGCLSGATPISEMAQCRNTCM